MATTVANPSDLNLGAQMDRNSPAQLEAPRGVRQEVSLRQNLPVSTSGNTLPAGLGLNSIMSQPAVQKAMPAILVLVAVGLFLLAYSWIQTPPYKTVYPGLSESDRQAAYTALSSAEFSAKIDAKTGELKVPDDRYHEARIFLASRGLPQGSTAGGMSALNDDTSMTTSQFMEQVRYVNAMEQELARSITQIGSIQGARVHLASPKQSGSTPVARGSRLPVWPALAALNNLLTFCRLLLEVSPCGLSRTNIPEIFLPCRLLILFYF
jgi:flagellar M-ring protein FliF